VNLTSPFSLALAAIVALSLLGVPVGHAMIGGSVLYLYLKGMDMGIGRRAAAQRHLLELPAAGDSAVHPGRQRS
jgi:hypothetical protein